MSLKTNDCFFVFFIPPPQKPHQSVYFRHTLLTLFTHFIKRFEILCRKGINKLEICSSVFRIYTFLYLDSIMSLQLPSLFTKRIFIHMILAVADLHSKILDPRRSS